MTDPAADIIDLYQRHGAAWLAKRSTDLLERGWMERFETLLPRSARILDLGCGSGLPIARYFAGLGHEVTGIDSAPDMIARFRSNLPAQEGHVADMRTLSLERRFDGIIAWNSFFHLNHRDQRAMFRTFADHAAPGAALMFTSGPAHGEALGELEGDTLYHASLAPEEYRDRLDEAGFDVIDHVAEDASCGNLTIWLARQRSADVSREAS